MKCRLVVALLFFFALCGLAQASEFAGTWQIKVPRPGGVLLPINFVLHPGANRMKVTVVMGGCALDVPVAQWNGTTLVLEPLWSVTYSLRLQEKRMRVSLRMGSGPVSEYWAKPLTGADAVPPPPVPVPAWHDVPDNGLARTPPMGWNSWNFFKDKVTDKLVRQIADAMVANGMRDAGYTYVNIDDTWEGGRDAQGNIMPNRRFPDMKALADYVHSKGLKLGIYSSPGPFTCGGYTGSYGHEVQDARTFASWGIDYLKYDWCSNWRIYGKSALRSVYQKMGDALRQTGRPIVYSLCEYGWGDVWTWGPSAGGNLWRTTDDIQDNWKSMSTIGFDQASLTPYASPGHWNDPDMLEVGNGGMTSVEYRTHFSLWSLLAAPLIAGNDLRAISPETLSILMNREVIAIDQDPLGKPARRISRVGGREIWSRPLQGGATAVGLFNRGEQTTVIHIAWSQLGLKGQPVQLRDLWAHKDLAIPAEGYSARVPAHGVVLLRLR